MTVVYFGMYNFNYPRNKNLISGLTEVSVEVRQCNSPVHLIWGLRYLKLLKIFFQIKAWEADVIVVGFPGQTDMPLAWLLGKIFHQKIVFDAFISLYNTHVDDRKTISANSWKAKILFLADRWSCLLPDHILLDTNQHINFFSKKFSIPKNKFSRVFVGTDENIFTPRPKSKNKSFIVGFHGSFLPLQGVDIIIRAAERLRNQKIVFKLLGNGPTLAKCRQLVVQLKLTNIKFSHWIPYSKLPQFIAGCDIYLAGPFGVNLKSKLVIPNKAFEAIACRRAVILGDTPATRELFSDGVNCLFVIQGDPIALADKITILQNSAELRNKIAVGGYKLFRSQATKVIIAKRVKNILYDQCKKFL